MTNFEKLKNMTQDEAVEYLRNGLCVMYRNCEGCPMLYGYDVENCISDIFADWIETQTSKE